MNGRPIQTILSIQFREKILKRCLIRNDFHINYQTLRTISQTLVRREQSNNLGKEHDIGKLKKLFQCTADEATRVYDVLPDHSLEDVVESVNWLKLRNATLPAILDNCHLLLIPLDSIKKRYKLLTTMVWKQTDHFLPFLNLDEEVILKSKLVEINRIRNYVYDFAEALSIEPEIVSKYFSKHPIIFSIKQQLLEQKLNILLDFNVRPEAILKDLGVLFRKEDKMRTRLEFLASNEVDPILPWMVKCPQQVIQKTLDLQRKRSAKIVNNFNKQNVHDEKEFYCVEEFIHEPEVNHLDDITDSSSREKSIEKLKKLFKCSEKDAYKVFAILRGTDLDEVARKINWLKSENVSRPVILDNCRMLLKSMSYLENNFILLKALEWQKTDDFVPLLRMSKTKIIRMGSRIRNRIYDFATEFSVDPQLVSNYFVKHTFIFNTNLDLLKRRTKLLLDHNIRLENILRDLKVLDVGEEMVKSRLSLIEANGIGHVMPWMIKCSESALQRTFNIRSKQTTGQMNLLDYLTRRLKWHTNFGRMLFKTHTYLGKLNINEVSSVLDVLMKWFTVEQITENIHILQITPAKLKNRINEIESMGEMNEIILAKTDDEFNKYLELLKKSRN